MAEPQTLAKLYNGILRGILAEGRSPHYTELATKLGLSTDEARQALHELDRMGVPGFWVRPDTDLVESCAPFSNIPTQYRISIDGKQSWYGQ